jgi:hypothetical protein
VQRLDRKLIDLAVGEFVTVAEALSVINIDQNRGNYGSGFVVTGSPKEGWGPSTPHLEAAGMQALRQLLDVEPLVRLLFPHPVARVDKVLDDFFSMTGKWLRRDERDHSGNHSGAGGDRWLPGISGDGAAERGFGLLDIGG